MPKFKKGSRIDLIKDLSKKLPHLKKLKGGKLDKALGKEFAYRIVPLDGGGASNHCQTPSDLSLVVLKGLKKPGGKK